MNDIPLSDACLSEVLARVSYRLLELYYRRYPLLPHEPLEFFSAVAFDGLLEYFPIMQTWVLAYSREWSPMTPTKFRRDAFIFRARQGWTWRRVVFPQYKRNRSDPRVTNRGVAREGFSKERPQ